MRRKRLFWQLYPSYLLVIVLALFAITVFASAATRRFFRAHTAGVLEAHARAIQLHIARGAMPSTEAEARRWCQEMGGLTGARVTIILPSGVVVGDSESNPLTMENHGDRPEVIQAMAKGVGISTRPSPTLRTPMMYVAVQAQDLWRGGLVVRTAMSLGHIDQTVQALRLKIALAGLGVTMVAAVICWIVSRRIAHPIEKARQGVERLASGDLSHRLPIFRIEEIGCLASATNDMAGQLQERIHTITAQRNEQDAVFFSMVEGVLAVDAQERVIRMNRAAGRLLDTDPARCQGKIIHEAVRNVDLQRFIAQTLTGPTPTEAEISLHGGEQWLQAHGTILNDASGRRMGAVVVLNDVTQLRRLEAFRRDFVANVSHELRTPITSIRGFVETLLDGALREPESAQRFLGIVSRQVARLDAIINDLLLLSRLEQPGDKATIPTGEALIRGVLDTAIEICLPKAEAKGMAVSVRCEADLRARVNVPLLEQAVVNLVDNAIKYSDPGKSVFVEAARRGDTLEISVRDGGCGIATEHLPRVFERFYRVDKSRSREMGGTGLGLAIVKHIALAHGGSVAAESALGRGSVFTITIPAR